jgi:flagellar capping protein FliD
MAAFNKFNQFVADLASGVHQLQTGTTHVLKVALTNTAPTATNTVLANITEVANGNGYTTGGISVGTITGAQTSGTFKLTGGTDPVWTASGAGFTARYAVLYNDSPTSPADPLIGWWDYGSSVTLAAGETFTVDLDQVNGILTLA